MAKSLKSVPIVALMLFTTSPNLAPQTLEEQMRTHQEQQQEKQRRDAELYQKQKQVRDKEESERVARNTKAIEKKRKLALSRTTVVYACGDMRPHPWTLRFTEEAVNNITGQDEYYWDDGDAYMYYFDKSKGIVSWKDKSRQHELDLKTKTVVSERMPAYKGDVVPPNLRFSKHRCKITQGKPNFPVHADPPLRSLEELKRMAYNVANESPQFIEAYTVAATPNNVAMCTALGRKVTQYDVWERSDYGQAKVHALSFGAAARAYKSLKDGGKISKEKLDYFVEGFKRMATYEVIKSSYWKTCESALITSVKSSPPSRLKAYLDRPYIP